MSTSRRRFLLWAPTVAGVGLLGASWVWFRGRIAVLGDVSVAPIDWKWAAIGTLCLIVHAVNTLALWRAVLVSVGVRQSWRDAMDAFVPSLLPRWIPGRVWANLVRVGVSTRLGIGVLPASGAVFWETVLGLTAAGVIALATSTTNIAQEYRAASWALVALGALAWATAFALKRPPRGLLRAFGISLLGWFFFAAAHVAMLRAIAPPGSVDAIVLAGALALAWSAGFLALVVPMGLGVRDVLLVLLLAPAVEEAVALQFVAMSRVAQLGVDAGLTTLWLFIRRPFRASPSVGRGTPGPPAVGD